MCVYNTEGTESQVIGTVANTNKHTTARLPVTLVACPRRARSPNPGNSASTTKPPHSDCLSRCLRFLTRTTTSLLRPRAALRAGSVRRHRGMQAATRLCRLLASSTSPDLQRRPPARSGPALECERQMILQTHSSRAQRGQGARDRGCEQPAVSGRCLHHRSRVPCNAGRKQPGPALECVSFGGKTLNGVTSSPNVRRFWC